MSYESLGIKDYENFPNNENNPIIDIRVKYHNPELNHFVYIEKGDWIDMYTAERVFLKKGDFRKISLGVSIELPEGYEAIMAERSSTFERYGIIQANGIAIFDESFKGDNDIWKFPAVATRDVVIEMNTRICQFRIIKHQPLIRFNPVNVLGNPDRGSFGSTGN